MFDDRLKQLRLKKSLNMKQVAKELDIPYTTYVGYEKDTREPDSEILKALADFYDCTIDFLLGRSDNAMEEYNVSYSNSNKQALLTSRQQRIVDLFGRLTEPQQDNIIGRAEMLAEQNEACYVEKENA